MRQILLILLLLAMVLPVAAQEEEPLAPDKWPTTIEATVADILSALSAEDKAELRSTKKEDLIMFHHGWGTGIRITTAFGAATPSSSKLPVAKTAIRTMPP